MTEAEIALISAGVALVDRLLRDASRAHVDPELAALARRMASGDRVALG